MEKSIDELNIAERVAPLDGGLSIWKIGLDRLREQDKNARVMADNKFKTLRDNIAKEKRLESLPFVTKNPVRENEFAIISGHHRTRAAKMAGQTYVYCIVDENTLTPDQIKSKQLAHNALQGFDDPTILSQIWNEISDLELKIASGVTNEDVLKDVGQVKVDEVDFEYQTKQVAVLFTDKGFEDFVSTVNLVEGYSQVMIASFAEFYTFVKTVRQVSEKENVRNIAGILLQMCKIVKEHYKNQEAVKSANAAEAVSQLNELTGKEQDGNS